MKRVISICAIFILNIVCFCNVEASEADSIRRILPTLDGKERIVALSNLCRLARAQSDPKIELAAIRDYIKEAHKQEDFESEGSARSTHILCFYNYDMTDSIDYYLPQHLKFMAKHGLWNYYYNSWNAKIEQDIYLSKIQTALRGAQKMYQDA